MSEYDERAAEFLRKTDTALKIERVSKTYYDRKVIDFSTCPPWDDKKHIHGDKYLVTLARGSRSYSFDFWNSYVDKVKGVKPGSYDVLSCLDGFCPDTFKEFCSEFDYNEDSIKAEKTFKTVQAQTQGLMNLFDDKELEMLGEIS